MPILMSLAIVLSEPGQPGQPGREPGHAFFNQKLQLFSN